MGITIKEFNGNAVTPKDDALLQDLIFKQYGVVDGVIISFLGANQIKIGSGRGIIKGRRFEITEENQRVQLSSAGAKVGRLYISVDLSNAQTPVKFLSYTGATLPKLRQDDKFNDNNGIFEMELCNYNVNETAVTNLKTTYPKISSCMQIAKTVEECAATTQDNVAAGAKALSEINSNLGGLRFGIDTNGNYGYKKAGADTVTPFSIDFNGTRISNIIKLGTGTSFNVTIYPNYSKFTVDNFIISPAGSFHTTGNAFTKDQMDTRHHWAAASFSVNKSYNQSTGIFAASLSGHSYVDPQSLGHQYGTGSVIAYLLY